MRECGVVDGCTIPSAVAMWNIVSSRGNPFCTLISFYRGGREKKEKKEKKEKEKEKNEGKRKRKKKRGM